MKIIKISSYIVLGIAIATFIIKLYIDYTSVDTEGPIITMDEAYIKVSTKDADSILIDGITAFDETDGDVTNSILIEYKSDIINGNQREVSIVAFDSNMHVSKVVRTIEYIDYTKPEFELNTELRFPLNTSVSQIMKSISATDVIDGDITSRIQEYGTNSESFNSAEAGRNEITYSVTNSVGDIEKIDVIVEIYDSTEVQSLFDFELKQWIVYINQGDPFDPYDMIKWIKDDEYLYLADDDGKWIAEDTEETLVLEFDLSKMEIVGSVNTQEPGCYSMQYKITDIYDIESTATLIVRVREWE
ncbi:MAG: hypothetical protein R3Y47_00320 [Lachnospiraceae bacterium]